MTNPTNQIKNLRKPKNVSDGEKENIHLFYSTSDHTDAFSSDHTDEISVARITNAQVICYVRNVGVANVTIVSYFSIVSFL